MLSSVTNIELLLHFDGTDVDSSYYNHNMSVFGSASVNAVGGEFGGCAVFTSQFGQGFFTPISSGTGGLDLHHQAITVQCWINTISTANQAIVWSDLSSTIGGFMRLYVASGFVNLDAEYPAGSYSGSNPASVHDGTWHHVVLQTTSTMSQIAVDGVWGSSAAYAFDTGANVMPRFQVGYDYTGQFDGQANGFVGSIDELQISTGSTYSFNTSFTPPAAPTSPPMIASGTAFTSVIQWPYIDMGNLGINKMLLGLDLVGTGQVNVQIAYNQQDPTTFNDNALFTTSTGVTTPYSISMTDVIPGQPIPYPINAPSFSLILTFPGNVTTANNWSWDAANFYLMDESGGGATG